MSEDNEREKQEIFSKPVKAGKRTYFFDVKCTKSGALYLTITESKKRIDHEGKFYYEKHKIFLYREDFEKFLEGFNEATEYIKENSSEEPVRPSDGDVSFDEL
ncbi:MAG: PUR family DNA/RNA-binding protein [Bacteroidia bacterium]|nr:PUR family DNA/RNA-binding protein [Bacteroidia bacterium]